MKHFFLIVFLVSFCSYYANAQIFKKKDRACETCPRHLVYNEYWDAENTIVNAKGHYCYGLPCKSWRYYHQNGEIRMKVKYRKRLKIKYYRDNGQLEKKGYAMLDLDKEDLHFYWHGLWKYFNDHRKLYRIALYQNGNEAELIMGPEDPIYYE